MEQVMSFLQMFHSEASKYMHRADCAKQFNYIRSQELTERLASHLRKQCGKIVNHSKSLGLAR
jgi:hypothetical protein